MIGLGEPDNRFVRRSLVTSRRVASVGGAALIVLTALAVWIGIRASAERDLAGGDERPTTESAPPVEPLAPLVDVDAAVERNQAIASGNTVPSWIPVLAAAFDAESRREPQTLAGSGIVVGDEPRLLIFATNTTTAEASLKELINRRGLSLASESAVEFRQVARSQADLDSIADDLSQLTLASSGAQVSSITVQSECNCVQAGLTKLNDAVRAELGTRFGDAVHVYLQLEPNNSE